MSRYSIWVLDYAAVNKFPQSVMLYGPQYVGIRNLPYAYALIKGRGEVILVDTGYDHKEYGKYLAELYNPENQAQLIARTEAIYANQAAAVLGLVQVFKDAVARGVRVRQVLLEKKILTEEELNAAMTPEVLLGPLE